MADEAGTPFIEIDGVIWCPEDVGLSANGIVVQLKCLVLPWNGKIEWEWSIFDSEYRYQLAGEPDSPQNPQAPFRRMRLVPADVSSFTSTMCFCGDMRQLSMDGQFIRHISTRTGELCPPPGNYMERGDD